MLKKYTNGSWSEIECKKYGNKAEEFAEFPVTIRGDGNDLTDYSISGNMEQTGTPTPENPITPSECGERTKNLFDKDNADIVDLYPDLSREIMQSSNLSTWSIVLPVEPSTTYTFTMGEATTAIRRRVGMCSDYPTKGAYCTSVDDTPEYDHPNLGNIFTTDADTRYVLIMYVSGAGRNVAIERANRVQVVKGNTALPYEPYGYKIPISSANTTTPVYLGNVQTTRYIKKRIFDGTENWTVSRAGTENEYYAISGTAAIQGNGYSSHYIYRNITTSNTVEGMFVISTGGVRVRDKSFSSVSDFKSFLAQQYANGTPVTVWYVLATPTTGIVNEPLRKIGEYADTLSMEQAGVQIPTNKGSTVIDVETELKPSEIEIEYTGWHDASVHEKSRNLFDEDYTNISGTIQYRPIYVGSGNFTLSTTIPYDLSVANIFLLNGDVTSGASTLGNGAWLNHNVTAQSVDGYVTIAYRHYSGTTSPVDCQTMLNTGSTALPYEPYWK